MRCRLLVVVAVAMVAAACSGGSRGASTSSTSSGGPSGGGAGGETMDEPYTALDGSTVTLASYRGSPVLVNFFASTCRPCLKEMPALEQVKQEATGKVRFVGIDVGDTVEGTRSFVAAVGVTWDIGRDPDGSMAAGIGSVGLPTTVVLDPEGRVVFKHLGALELDQLRSELRTLGYL